MKKFLLSINLIAACLTVSAQTVDTLSSFFTGTPAIYGYAPSATNGGGYLSGNNGYGDLGKGMRFNSTTGLIASGTINKVLLWAPIKSAASANSTFSVKILTFVNDSTLGTVLGTATMPLSQVDTTLAGYGTAHGRPYNVKVSFNPAVTIPANKDVMVMVYLPTAAGDTLVLMSNTKGNFSAAVTNTFELWSDNTLANAAQSWATSASDLFNAAWAIYPVVSFTASLEENTLTAAAYPNPATDELTIQLNAVASTVSIIEMSGKVLLTQPVASNVITLSVADLLPGMYFYQVVGENGAVTRNTFIKK